MHLPGASQSRPLSSRCRRDIEKESRLPVPHSYQSFPSGHPSGIRGINVSEDEEHLFERKKKKKKE